MENETNILKSSSNNYKQTPKYRFFNSNAFLFIMHCITIIILSFFLLQYMNYNKSFNQLLITSKKISNFINGNDNLNQFIIYNSNDKIAEKLNLLKYMTNNNKLKYQGAQNCLLNDPDSQYCIYHLINPKKIIGKKRILLGSKKDGSYVLLDDFDNIKIAYSFGISKMIQFDEELAKRGIDVYMYDYTIDSLPFQNIKFHWKKIGIAGKSSKEKNLKTLEELLYFN